MGEKVFIVAAAAVLVQVLVGRAQLAKFAHAKGDAIHQIPKSRQVKALGHLPRVNQVDGRLEN